MDLLDLLEWDCLTLYLIATWLVVTPFLTIAGILSAIFRWTFSFVKVANIQNRFVFITGCDTGFGRGLVDKLLDDGFKVFAGCYTEGGEKELSAIAGRQKNRRLWPLRLNITEEASVQKSLQFVKSQVGTEGLWALVNNAGKLECTVYEDWRTVTDYTRAMDVNFFGHVRMTQAFLPLIKTASGRLIFTASTYSHGSFAATGPYASAKHATLGYARTLRAELTGDGVDVVVISPGHHAGTGVSDLHSHLDEARDRWQSLPQHTRDTYPKGFLEKRMRYVTTGEMYLRFRNNMENVVNAMSRAVKSKWPQMNYWVGYDGSYVAYLSLLPEDNQHVLHYFSRWFLGDVYG